MALLMCHLLEVGRAMCRARSSSHFFPSRQHICCPSIPSRAFSNLLELLQSPLTSRSPCYYFPSVCTIAFLAIMTGFGFPFQSCFPSYRSPKKRKIDLSLLSSPPSLAGLRRCLPLHRHQRQHSTPISLRCFPSNRVLKKR